MELTGPAIEAEIVKLNKRLLEQVEFWQEKSFALDAQLTNLEETNKNLCDQILRFKTNYDPKHNSKCECYGCRRFKRCLIATAPTKEGA